MVAVIFSSTAPLVTVSPTAAVRPVTVPDLWAVIGCSIFIASSTTTRSPASTCWPSSTAILTIVPCMGAVEGVAAGAAAAVRTTYAAGPWRAGRRASGRPARRGRPGRTTSSRLPPTSTTTRSRSPARGSLRPCVASNGGTVLSHSVSIQRVCTRNGVLVVGGEGRVADDGPVERQHRRHALDDELGQRPAGALERLLPVGAGDDELGQHASRRRRR